MKKGFTLIELYGNSYFDKNSSGLMTHYFARILGDATGEMGPFYNYEDEDEETRSHNSWYEDYAHFAYPHSPWFQRGGGYDNGKVNGQLHFARSTGGSSSGLTFRVVILGHTLG